jgi:hypothetical protein
MINNIRRISIFTGNLGSGKTELAVNFALWLKKKHQRIGIVDLDIINPYFRTRIMKDYLEKMGLRVICPPGELAGADVPALSPAILGVLEDEQGMGVFDVGGDDIGATALGRFKPYLPEGTYHMYFVANACRPFTGNTAGIVKMLRSVEKASRLKVTALVSNTNLGLATEPETVMAGHAIVEETARQLQLPVAFMAVKNDLVPEMTRRVPQVPVLPVDLRMLPPWLRE